MQDGFWLSAIQGKFSIGMAANLVNSNHCNIAWKLIELIGGKSAGGWLRSN